VIEIATGEALGTFDSEADVALCLAFTKLVRDEAEIVADISPMAMANMRKRAQHGRARVEHLRLIAPVADAAC